MDVPRYSTEINDFMSQRDTYKIKKYSLNIFHRYTVDSCYVEYQGE